MRQGWNIVISYFCWGLGGSFNKGPNLSGVELKLLLYAVSSVNAKHTLLVYNIFAMVYLAQLF